MDAQRSLSSRYTQNMSAFQRLTALDAMFVGIENAHMPMHVGALMVFAEGPLCQRGRAVDLDLLVEHIETTLDSLPRYRQRLRRIPLLRHPIWVDDEHFNLRYHLRHVALPGPGDERQLKRLAGRIYSTPLDRERPLWEIYLVEGLDKGGFALIGKVHHSMVDGVGGVEMIARLLRATSDANIALPASHWQAQPPPPRWRLLQSELGYRKKGIYQLARRARHGLAPTQGGSRPSFRDTLRGVSNLVASGLSPASPTAINPHEQSPHRRIDWCRFPLADLKAVKNGLGGKLNDVVLAICAGALRAFLVRLGDRVDLHKDFRVLMPVSTRHPRDNSGQGNEIALTILRLPVHLCDEDDRYHEILERTQAIKEESHQVEGVSFLEDLSDVTMDAIMRDGVRVAGKLRPFNVLVTNVPGPPFPLYLLGSRLTAMVPFVPLFEQQALGIAVFSYAGEVYFALSGDWQALPNLHELTDDFRDALESLKDLAAASSRAPTPDPAGQPQQEQRDQ